MDYWLILFCFVFVQKQRFEVKDVLMDLFFLQTCIFSTSQDVNWWTGIVWITCVLLWCFYQLFWHPFTAEDPLMSKWWNATFLQICSHEETNSSTSWMVWGKYILSNFIFLVKYSFHTVNNVLLLSVDLFNRTQFTLFMCTSLFDCHKSEITSRKYHIRHLNGGRN